MIQSVSPSMLHLSGLCGEKVRRRYFERDEIPSGIEAKVGSGVHKAAEVNSRSKVITQQDEPLDVILDAARDGYMAALQEGVFFSPAERSGAKLKMAEGVDKTVALARLYRENIAPGIMPIAVEQRFTGTLEGIPVPIVGIVDVLTADACPDLKTSKQKWPKLRAQQDIQLTFYAWLVHENTGIWPATSYEILVASKVPQYQHLPAPRKPQDMEALVPRIQVMLSMFKAGLFPPADPGHWCCSSKWCGYWWTCPYIPEHRKLLRSAA